MRRRSIAVAVPFPVYPPISGGQVRLHELSRRLARWMDVELVCLAPGGTSSREEVEPGYRQVVVGAAAEHRAREAELRGRLGGLPVTDVAMPWLLEHTPDYLRAFRRAASGADLQVASHPYAAPVMAPASAYLPLVYEAHNVEVELKAPLLDGSPLGREVLRLVEAVEGWCARAAARVVACSDGDCERLARRYRVPAEKIALVPNGVDDERIRFTEPRHREGGAAECLFIGSNHPPNAAAVRFIATLARQMPDVRFTVAGNVRDSLRDDALPDNLHLLGTVTDERKAALLASAAVALNPIAHGSGTSLKALEYCAAGAPVLSTPEGMRGLDDLAPACALADLETFGPRLRELLARPAEERSNLREARRVVEQRYSWRIIAERARQVFEEVWA